LFVVEFGVVVTHFVLHLVVAGGRKIFELLCNFEAEGRKFVDCPLFCLGFLAELLLNAVQAMEGGGQLVVRTRPSGLGVVLELIDTGPGMDAETLGKVFQTFYTTKQGGSGLGLPTARKIVEAHGGTIDIETAPGRGTKLTIWLPAPPRLPPQG
jgi:K+-sensing histidine kinase KdpD